MTDRINVVKDGPSTRFVLEADRISTSISGNYSIVRCYLRAHNGPSGTSGSFFGGSGVQAGRVNNVEFGRRSGDPFLPSGYARNAQRWRIGPFDVRVNHAANGTGSADLQMHLVYGSIATSHSATLALPNIPRTPGTLQVTRNSDSQHTLNWSRTSTYTSVVVQRRTDGGAWQQVGVASGNAFTFTDTTTAANRKYEYRVAGKAAAGQSGWSNTVTVYTTPAAPSGVSAVRSGNNIVVSASGVPPYATSFDIRDGATVVATSVSLPWTHVAPNPAVPHTYSVRGKVGSLTGAYSAPSNTVQLISPPNAPTGLSPNGGVVPSDEDTTFIWVHNPVDASPQSAYELRYREPAGEWTVVAGATASTLDVTLGVSSIEWQVRTKGEHPDWSQWSATATTTVIDRPGVAVVSPEEEWDASTLPVSWSWLQMQGRPQSAWQVELVNSAGDVVSTREGSGATNEATFGYRLGEGEWTVNVRAATGDVWSVWASQTFTVTFDPPAPPLVEGVWDDTQGGVFLTVSVGVSGVAMQGEDGAWYAEFDTEGVSNIGFDDGHPYIADGQDEGMLFDGPAVTVADVEPPATTAVTLERSIDGESWEPVAETDDVASLIDWESWSYGDIQYRATAFSAEGATSASTIVVEARSGSLWLSGGVGFGVTARLPFDPGVQVTAGRARVLKQYAGRSLPVAYAGEALSRVVSVSGSVMQRSGETAEVDELVRVAQLPDDRFMFRDPDGRRIYGAIGDVQLPRQVGVTDSDGFNAFWGYSFTMTETEPR